MMAAISMVTCFGAAIIYFIWYKKLKKIKESMDNEENNLLIPKKKIEESHVE